jgi:hypothetical protein
MAVHEDVITELGLHKGAMPLTGGQFRKRVEAYLRREWHPLRREQDAAGYATWVESMMPTVTQAEGYFVFNHQLAAYRKATARLAQYRVADGRPELTEEQPTGQYDEEGNEITETVVVQTAIDPLDAQVEQPVYDDEGNQTGTETVTNPLIVQDEAERAEAQAVVDATPQEVKDF